MVRFGFRIGPFYFSHRIGRRSRRRRGPTAAQAARDARDAREREKARAAIRRAELADMTPEEYGNLIDPDGSARRQIAARRAEQAQEVEAELARWRRDLRPD